MDASRIRRIVCRVPIFAGLTQAQADRVAAVCQMRSARKGGCLFREGDESDAMYVLLTGRLRVVTVTGAEIATIWEMGLVGEMGVLTGRPRSATVLAEEEAQLLCLRSEDLERLVESDRDLGYRIYRNVTHLLCARLRDSNILLEQHYLILEGLAGEDWTSPPR